MHYSKKKKFSYHPLISAARAAVKRGDMEAYEELTNRFFRLLEKHGGKQADDPKDHVPTW